MKTAWRTFRAVLVYEVRQGWRSPVWWLLALNFALPVLLISPAPFQSWVSLHQRLLRPLDLTRAFALLVFLAWVPLLERESSDEGYAMFWMQAESAGWVWAGKVAAGLTLTGLALLPALVYVGGVSLMDYGAAAVKYGALWLVLFGLSAVLLFAATTLLLHFAVPHPALRRALAVALGLALIFTYDLQDATRLLAPLGHYSFSLVTGLAPFGRLLLWQRLTWMLLSAGLIFLVLAGLVHKAPRILGDAERRWARRSAIGGGLLLLLAVGGGVLFHMERTRRFVEGSPLPSPPPTVTLCPQDYRLEVTFDLRRMHLHGTATAQGEWPTARLRNGLTITAQQGGSLTYAGNPRWPQTLFWCPACLRDVQLLQQRLFAPRAPDWLWVEGHLFLLPSGDWHPYPGCPIASLTLHVKGVPCPDGQCLVHSADEVQRQGDDWLLMWPHGVPTAPLMALGQAYRWLRVGERWFGLPRLMYSQGEQEEVAATWNDILEQMVEVGLIKSVPQTVAVGDRLRYPRLGERLMLVPTEMLAARSRADTPGRYRHVSALYALLGWWCEGRDAGCFAGWSQTFQQARKPHLPTDAPLNDPDALAQMLAQQPSDAASQMLLSLLDYAAFRLQSAEFPWQPHGGGDALSAAILEGRSERATRFLDTLYRQHPEAFWQIVRGYRERYGVQDVTLVDFAAWLQEDWGLTDLPTP